MFKLIIITIVLIIAFVAVTLFARHRSHQRAKVIEREYRQRQQFVPKQPEHTFGTLFQHQLSDIEEQERHFQQEPYISLSPTAKKLAETDVTRSPTIGVSPDDISDTPATDAQSIFANEPIETTLNDIKITLDTDNIISEQLIILSIVAPKKQPFSGSSIGQVLTDLSLVYDQRHIYQRIQSGTVNACIFSIANIVKPGMLSRQQLDYMMTPGLVLFMELPNAINPMMAFDDMLDTATEIAARLGGEVCDEQRNTLTDSQIETIRHQLFNYNLANQQEHY